jgi:hypothetical protein
MSSREDYIIKRIGMIEEDLGQLKALVSAGKGNIVSLRGLWEGVNAPDEDVEEAKRSLFRGTPDYNVDDHGGG